MKKFFDLLHFANEKHITKDAELGHVCEIMSLSGAHQHYPLQHIRTVIKPALVHKQLKVYFNSRGEPVAYVAWAHIAPDVEQRFQRSGAWDLHMSEWNEGGCLWIIDMAAPGGHIRFLLDELRDNLFANEPRVRYFRLKRKRLVCKEIERNRRNAFFR